MAKRKLHIFIPGLPQKDKEEYRRGDSILAWSDWEEGEEPVAVLIDGGEGDLFDAMVKEMKRLGIRHVVFILTHWHSDHDNGLLNALNSSWIIVDKVIAPDPEELKLVPKDYGWDEYSRAMKRIGLAKDLKKPIEYPAAGKRVGHWCGKLRFWMWRQKANPNDYTDYQVNNTSIRVYFPDLQHLETGDAISSINDFFEYVKKQEEAGTSFWPITSFSIEHHGNGLGDDVEYYRERDAKICWYSDWEPKGVPVGGTSFSKHGAGKAKPYLWCLRPFQNIYVEADGAGYVTWKQGDKEYKYEIAYGEKYRPKEEEKADPEKSQGGNSPKLRDMSTLFGVDVGYSQGKIDWDKLAPHIDFAILECGYGQDLKKQDDSQFERNAKECERLGIPYTAYLYSYAGTAARASGEADHILRLVDGKQISLPLYYDIEEKTCKPVARSIMDTWAAKVESKGYWAGVYSGEYYWNSSNLNGCERYTKWIAKYGANNGKIGNPPNVPNVDIWQYASKGVKIPGINSQGLDVNIMYKVDLIKEITGKDYIQAAKDVWAGNYGGGEERVKKLTEEGFDARIVQHFVNRMKA